MTDGGADYCFECIGLASLMAEATRSSREACSCAHKISYISLTINNFVQSSLLVFAYFFLFSHKISLFNFINVYGFCTIGSSSGMGQNGDTWTGNAWLAIMPEPL